MIELLIKGLLLGWFINEFQPLQEIITRVNDKISDKYFLVMYIKGAFSCWKCLSFWCTLILSHNIYYAMAAGFIV